MSETPPSGDQSEGAGRSPTDPVQRTAFWAAIALPFAEVGVFLLGIEGLIGAAVLLALVVANVLALVVGHQHLR